MFTFKDKFNVTGVVVANIVLNIMIICFIHHLLHVRDQCNTLHFRQLAYDSSHFCPLLPMEEGDAFVPLVDCMLAALPVRFAYDPDIDSPQPVEELLNKSVFTLLIHFFNLSVLILKMFPYSNTSKSYGNVATI